MGKKKQQGEPTVAVAEPTEPIAEPAATAAGQATYRVTLSGGPPIQFPSLEIEADCGEAAQEEFCRRNGISGSANHWTIERIS